MAAHLTRGNPARLRNNRPAHRRGNILVLSAIFMVVMLGMVAFAVDLGYIVNTQTELRRAVDAGALAGAGVLVHGSEAVQPVAREFVRANFVGTRVPDNDGIEISTGHWDGNTKAFTHSDQTPSALRVVVHHRNQPLFFARVFGKEKFDLSAEAIAQYQPRDIMLVLDFSASMNDDSTFAAFGTLGQSYVENNLAEIYADLGSPTFGNMVWNPSSYGTGSTSNSNIKNHLGITNVPYPYPGGSWDQYIDYIQGLPSGHAHRRRYGYLTFVEYLLTKRPSHADTPALCHTRSQPAAALKDATEVFLSYMQQIQTEDRLGLVVYNSASATSVLESGLTPNLSHVNTLVQGRQAGHYNNFTNIGAGMQAARLELQNNARPGAFKMIVLMTDGIANRPTDEATARALVRSEADLCAAARIPIVSISLGAGADVALMQEVADDTRGAHFNIPGGQTASQYEEQLIEIFGQVAATRPLKLVQ